MLFTFKDLIDVAIGSPESGHVNFYALHVLLSGFAQKLDCLDEVVEQDGYLQANVRLQSSYAGLSYKLRMEGGADNEEAAAAAAEAAPAEEEPAAPEETAAPEEAPEAAEELPAAVPETAPAVELEELPPVAVPETAPEVEPEEPPPAAAPETAPEVALEEPTPAATRTISVAPSGAGLPTSTSVAAAAAAAVDEEQPVVRAQKVNMGIDSTVVNNIHRLEKRISKVELHKEQAALEMQQFANNLGGQIKLTMEQLNNVTHLLLDREPSPERVRLLRQFARQLRVLMRATNDDEVSISWTSQEPEAIIEEVEMEEELLDEEESSLTEKTKPEEEATLGLEQHTCYTPERMLDELLQLKSDICALTNKVNEVAAAMLKQDAQRLKDMMKEVQDAMRDLKLSNASNRETMSQLTNKVNTSLTQLGQVKLALTHMDDIKIDKTEVELLLAEKVDFQQLATKVSLEQLEEYKSRLEKQFCEVRHIISFNEKNLLQIIDNLRMTLGVDALELTLKDFRDMIEKRVAMVADALQKYMEMTNDDCAAAAGRAKVMQDLACLSCDTPCVMRTVERSKVPKLSTAKGSTGMAPIVTYELGAIRKSGIMGYYRKDEFPHATHAWSKGSQAPMPKCVPRHAGGTHTIHTADDHMQKVILSKRNTGW